MIYEHSIECIISKDTLSNEYTFWLDNTLTLLISYYNIIYIIYKKFFKCVKMYIQLLLKETKQKYVPFFFNYIYINNIHILY